VISLEVLTITAIALLVIFAAVPVVVQQIYQYQALVEARAAAALFSALADSIESDMGAAYAQRILNVPALRFGGLEYITVAVGRCGGAPVYNTTLVYRSQYLALFGQLRGTRWARLVRAPESPLAVAAWGAEISLAPRAVNYGGVVVLLNMTYSAGGEEARRATGAGIYYEVQAPASYRADQCELQGIDLSGASAVVVIPVALEPR
jgi:hypothetical protein